MKILILRFSSIGDIVLTTPVVRNLKKKFPEAEIHYATKNTFHSILQHNPYLTKIHLLQHSIFELIRQLKTEKFDYVIDLHNNQRTFLIKTLLGVKSFSFNKLNFEKWLMVNFKINKLPKKHIVDRYLETCQKLGVENDEQGLDYFIAEADEIDLNTLPQDYKNGYIAWAIGAKQFTKRFTTNKIISTIHSPNFPALPILLLGGKEDFEEGQKIKWAIDQLEKKHSKVLLNTCGKFSLNQSASLVKQAQLVITNDTSLMHIAAAFKKRIVSIWGNTIPEFGMQAYKTESMNVEVENLSCRPCSKLGYGKCPQGHFKCMNNITTEVEAAVLLMQTI